MATKIDDGDDDDYNDDDDDDDDDADADADGDVDTVSLTPCNDAVCYVNGTLVTEPTTLKTGSRVIFGRTHVFRFMQPNQGR